MTVTAIILGAGAGNRFEAEIPKQFIKIAGLSIIEHTMWKFENNQSIDEIIIVIHPDYYEFMNELVIKNNFKKVKKVVKGGKTRKESSYAGLCACETTTEKVLIHDAVRMFVSNEIIDKLVYSLDKYNAVDVAMPCQDTIIEIDDNHMVKSIPQRNTLMRGQTPQGFKFDLIKKAHDITRGKEIEVTDDCGLISKLGLDKILVIDGSERNIKITYPEDVYLADKLFQINSVSSNRLNTVPFDSLQGKVLVVFGHSSGIGHEIMLLGNQYGARVYGFSRSTGVNVADYDSVLTALESVYKTEGRIDLIANTAGLMTVSKLEAQAAADIRTEVDTNYLGSINVVRAAIPYLKQVQGSMVLFTSSSYTRGRAMYSVYSSSKAAIVNFVQAMAEELYYEKIRINVINPERTDTPLRRKNFGIEPPNTLLSPKYVAAKTLKALLSDLTGLVIDVRIPFPS